MLELRISIPAHQAFAVTGEVSQRISIDLLTGIDQEARLRTGTCCHTKAFRIVVQNDAVFLRRPLGEDDLVGVRHVAIEIEGLDKTGIQIPAVKETIIRSVRGNVILQSRQRCAIVHRLGIQVLVVGTVGKNVLISAEIDIGIITGDIGDTIIVRIIIRISDLQLGAGALGEFPRTRARRIVGRHIVPRARKPGEEVDGNICYRLRIRNLQGRSFDPCTGQFGAIQPLNHFMDGLVAGTGVLLFLNRIGILVVGSEIGEVSNRLSDIHVDIGAEPQVAVVGILYRGKIRLEQTRMRCARIVAAGLKCIGDGFAVIVYIDNRTAVTTDLYGVGIGRQSVFGSRVVRVILKAKAHLTDVAGVIAAETVIRRGAGAVLVDADGAAGRGAAGRTRLIVFILLIRIRGVFIIRTNLRPVYDGVGGRRRVPLGIEGGVRRQRRIEVEPASRQIAVGVPAVKGIAGAFGIVRTCGVHAGRGEHRSGVAGGGGIVEAVHRVVPDKVVVEAQPVTNLYVWIKIQRSRNGIVLSVPVDSRTR